MAPLLRTLAVLAAQVTLIGTAFSQSDDIAEIEYWRSADRLGTEAAYEAYLTQYPSGKFVLLARAALQNMRKSATTAQQVNHGAALPRPASSLRGTLASFSAPSPTGAVSFRIGDKFFGPGVITVGWLGARKQVILPNGEWTFLAAVDYRSTHASPIDMVSLAFGQFDGKQLHSLLVASQNRWPSRSQGNWWTDAAACEGDKAGKLWHQATPTFPVRSCMHVGIKSPEPTQREVPLALVKPLEDSLLHFKAEGSLAELRVRSLLFVTDHIGHYLKLLRLDAAAVADIQAVAQSRVLWARAYSPLAADGFSQRLSADDLKPSEERSTYSISLPD